MTKRGLRYSRREICANDVATMFESTVTGTTHHFSRLTDVVEEVGKARILGGMHCPDSVRWAENLGEKVARRLLRIHRKIT
jgi:hypothetical protein